MGDQERVERDPNPLQKLVEALPGFSGYLEREGRRDSDKLLRESLSDDIGDAVEKLEGVATKWSKAGELDYLDDLEQVAGRLRRAGDDIRYADYGYSGFFDLVQIDEQDLTHLYEYDLSLRSFIADISEDIDALAKATGDDIEDAIISLDESIAALADMIDDRESAATDLAP